MILHTFGSLPFGAGAFLGGTAGLTVWPATFWEALRSFLKYDPDLVDLSEVYFRRSAPVPVYPFLVVSPIDARPELNNTEDYWKSEQVQFSIVSTDDVEAVTL